MFRSKRSADDFAAEIKAHLELEADQLRDEGLNNEAARRQAYRAFGSVRAAQESFYIRGRLVWLDNLFRDLQFAARQIRRSPGFTFTAVLILTLGIAANVIVFGLLQGVVLAPLDVPRPDRVVTFAPQDGAYPIAAFPEVRDVRDGSTVFSAVAGHAMEVMGVDTNGTPQPMWGEEVSGQFFEAMGIEPVLGRLLRRSDDDHPGASDAVVLSYPAWQSHFAADPHILGKVIRVNKQPYTVVGVTPEGFYGTERFLQPDLFVPMANQPSLDGLNWVDDRRNKMVFPVARLKDGVTLAQAQSELDNIAARVRRQFPREDDAIQFKIAPPGLIGDFGGRPVRRFLAGVMVLAVVLLLAACVNLGSLFAARTADRTREIAIRLAIGSSRWRVTRQILLEALLISVLGGIGGYAFSCFTLAGLARWHPPSDYPVIFRVQPTPLLIAVTFLFAVVSGLLFGLLPLRQIFKSDPNDAIKNGAHPSAGRRWALRDVLLATQIALCCVTITAAFVAFRGLRRSLDVDHGFNPDQVVLTKFDLSQGGYGDAAAADFQRQLLENVTRLPGVTAAAYASSTPLGDPSTVAVFAPETTDLRPSNEAFDTFFFNISPGYFAAAQTRLLEGRGFTWNDNAKAPRVAVVNQQFARHLFHTEHAVGRHFKDLSGHLVEVVGIAADGKYFTLTEDPQEAIFFSILQEPRTATSLIVRYAANSQAAGPLTDSIRKVVQEMGPSVPIRWLGSWQSSLAFVIFPSRMAAVTLGLFGAFGLLLSMTGTFGLASYSVSKRLHELSIRVALGAQARQILSVALGRMFTLLGTGSLIGIILGVAASQVMSAIVYQASAQDPLVLAAVGMTMLLTGVLSVAGPVRRALHIDPIRLLREQ